MNSTLRSNSRLKQTPMAWAIRCSIAALLGVSTLSHAAGLPTGGHFAAGDGSIAGNGSSLTINQSSAKGVIDWNSFSIASGQHVAFNNGNGATLNRVTGGETSFILGKLSATGSVYLINPQGIVIGQDGVVSTGGRFVASTLDTGNTAFMNGGPLTFSGASSRRVVNLGKIGSSGSDVFLISSNEVDNFGSVKAPNGSAELAVGKTILLQDSSTGRQVFVLTGSRGNIVNRGAIEAAQASLQAADGNIYALSGNHAAIRATGTATRAGHVWLVADTGGLTIGESIGAHNADGSGGMLDTNAGGFAFVDAPAVLAGVWHIVTPAITIGAAAARLISHSLSAGTSVDLQTTGTSNVSGDIGLASSIGWQGNASLTLGAYRTVTITPGATLANQGSGNLTLRADATAIDNGGSVINNGTIDWSKSTGTVSNLFDMNGAYRAGTQFTNAAWTAPQMSGLVTQVTGYRLINSLDDLNALQSANADYAANYALGKDIDGNMSGSASQPSIGIGNHAGATFTGQFDGMGHSITNAFVGQGFFDTIGKGGVVRNVNITDSWATMYTFEGTEGAGLVARDNQGLISNVLVSGRVDSNGDAGGLVAHNAGTIQRAGSNATTTAYGSNGGLVGQNDGHIVQSYATGNLAPYPTGVGTDTELVNGGGLVGVNNGTIDQSYATGNLTGATWETNSGSLVGINYGKISQSFATGAVYGSWWDPHYPAEVGGIATGGGTIAPDVYWNAQTTGQTYGGPGLPASNGLSTAQMSTPASFAGWNFGAGGVWAMPAGATHPVLAWQVPPQ